MKAQVNLAQVNSALPLANRANAESERTPIPEGLFESIATSWEGWPLI
jgi:hypothetical protein